MEKAARELIRNEDITIAAIAESVGYGTTAVFCRHFKAFFGESVTRNIAAKIENRIAGIVNQKARITTSPYLRTTFVRVKQL